MHSVSGAIYTQSCVCISGHKLSEDNVASSKLEECMIATALEHHW